MVSLIKKKKSSNKTNKKRKSNFKKTGRRTKMSNKKSLRRNRMKHGGRTPGGEMRFIISTLYATISETKILEPKVKELKNTILRGFKGKTHITAVLDMLSYELALTGAFSGIGSGTSCTNKMFNKVVMDETTCRSDKTILYKAIKDGVERIKDTEKLPSDDHRIVLQAIQFLRNFKSKYNKAIGEYIKAHESDDSPVELALEEEEAEEVCKLNPYLDTTFCKKRQGQTFEKAPVELTSEEWRKKKAKWEWEEEQRGRAERERNRIESAKSDALFREQEINRLKRTP